MRGRHLQFVLLAAIAVAAGSSAAVSSGAAVDARKAQTKRGSILVASDHGIYRRYANGTLKQLTTSPDDQFPVWSRDGTQIAFVRYPTDFRDRFCRLFVINSDGTGVRQVGDVKTDCSGAGWGPGDRQLAFGGTHPSGNKATVWVVNVDGSERGSCSAGVAGIPREPIQPGRPMAVRSSSAGRQAASTACSRSARTAAASTLL